MSGEGVCPHIHEGWKQQVSEFVLKSEKAWSSAGSATGHCVTLGNLVYLSEPRFLMEKADNKSPYKETV